MAGQIIDDQAIFEVARKIDSREARQAYLRQMCGEDLAWEQRIAALLRAYEENASFLESPPPELAAAPTLDLPISEKPGAQIGPYKLLQQIGEGGMGVVFMAEQTEPVQRKVALKVIKPGMDTRQVIARFEAERQALAMMDHVNIARVLDAGTTGEKGVRHLLPERPEGGFAQKVPDTFFGRPYFVMELVHGVPITKYCDDNHLTPRQRLELFVPVCQAIQHAHQKGIIHRDIKPSNVMVTLYDGLPVPKVIDFGVAKATEQKLTERTLFTQFGTMVGTLEYMSPEQAEMSALGVDTRSDIYSLGVLLYELLTGSTPLSSKRMKEAAHAEILRLIKEEEPPKPSTRLSESGESLASISAQRHMEPAKLTKLLRGELDWIVMKTLEKDRNRRYETAGSFAADVQRYLADEQVQACPPSARYRLRKFARRNKAALVTASVVAAALLAGIAVATWQAVVATGSKQEALAAAAAEKESKETAQAREAETEAVLEFVENKVFAAARPQGQKGGLGREVTLRRAVEAAVPFVETSFPKQPLIEARLRMTLGHSFLILDEAKTAAEQFQAARKLYTQHGGPDHPNTLASMNNLSICYYALGRYAEALKLQEETLALKKAKLGFDHPDTLGSMVNLAEGYQALGRHADALELFEEALALMRAKIPDHHFTFNCMDGLANSYAHLARYADALKLNEETLALRKAHLGPDHLDTLKSMAALATSYAALGRHPEALKLREETLALIKTKLDPDHAETLASMNNLALSYAALGRHAEALKLNEETLALIKPKLGPNHPYTLTCMCNLAQSYDALGRHAEASKLHEAALALRKAQLGPDHPDTLTSMHHLAKNYYAIRQYADALKLGEQTLALMKAPLGPEHPDTLECMNNLANSNAALGRHAEALKLREEMLTLSNAKLGPDHVDTLASMGTLAWFLATCSDPEFRDAGRAVELAKKAVELSPKDGNYWETLGAAHYRASEWKAAVAALEKSMELSLGGDANDSFFLAMAHWQLDEKDEARKWFDQAVKWLEKNEPQDEELQRFRKEAAELLGVKEK